MLATCSTTRSAACRWPAAQRQRPPAAAAVRRRVSLVAEASAAEAAQAPVAAPSVFVVMNVFKVKPECRADFEEVWRSRESHLKEMRGFVRFALLKCENVEGKYISQTTWECEADFRAWTQSQQFSKSHGEGQGNKRPSVGQMLEGPPSPEFFSSVTVTE